MTGDRGRFAPSPTGPLHAGSLVAALASWLDARAAGGAWIVRIEDLDPPREVTGASKDILRQLAACGLESDEPVLFQSRRSDAYEAAFRTLIERRLVYGCACSRRDIEAAVAARPGWPAGVYPGTCAQTTVAPGDVRAWRVRVADEAVRFVDRAVGPYAQSLARDVGDFVIRRADGLWAYQLAVVVDDAHQRITDVVRGADLLDNTPRQIHLQRALGLPRPRYLHVPLVVNDRGEKLSKQTLAPALDTDAPLEALERAGHHLGLPRIGADGIAAFLGAATVAWIERFPLRP
ncbi:MAG TPA: tRNA glutamyl-Q(34) synthetase GluQRS [Burkholderiaceae bacterium]|nr:tRNA glutamyl-Q(34) synthetase GluQRS [Burkholderiaceae bacterium]